jgi:ADP-heptose:LPS heptosyltransferase
MTKEKILIIRMLDPADVVAVGLPAVRYFQQQFPNAELVLLAYGPQVEFVRLAEPSLKIMELPAEPWPDNILPAMEYFIGLAGKIIEGEYTQIVNLDTSFMPCFMARFLKDAGEPVVGNMIDKSVDHLLAEFQAQTLSPDYVNQLQNYLQSTFLGMSKWRNMWWQYGTTPDNGYPEFYLRYCCSFDQIDFNLLVDVGANHTLAKEQKKGKVIAIGNFFEAEQLAKLLEKRGYVVWLLKGYQDSVRKTLSRLKASDLIVCHPDDSFWYAKSVDCTTLLISGDIEPTTLMPDYATEPGEQLDLEELLSDINELFSS